MRFHYLFFDTQHTLEAWVRSSQAHQAWATRIMTEAFRRDNRMNTFAIHLFIDAFPSGWMKSIMDCERRPKPAYFAYREALTPLMASIRTDRTAFFSGERMQFEFWICNDTHQVPVHARLRYQVEVAGEVVFAQQTEARIEPGKSTFQGVLNRPVPSVARRTRAVVRLALTDQVGGILHDTAVELDFFPASEHVVGSLSAVAVLGAETGKAASLVRDLGIEPRHGLDGNERVILCDDPELFEAHRGAIEKAVAEGAVAVLLEWPVGEYNLGGSSVTVEECGMGARHFVSRATGHPFVSGFEPEDFRLWYDPSVDRVAPLLATCFHASDWTPILTTGNGNWEGGWGPAMAAAEKNDGKGCWRICNVRLSGRTQDNPVAELFAGRLMHESRTEVG